MNDCQSPKPFAEILHPKKQGFLISYAETGQVTLAAEAAGVHRTTVYHWKRNDAEFAAAFAIAREIGCETLVDEAVRRSRDGVRRLRFDKNGKPLLDPETGQPYVEHVYSDVLLIFLLKNLLPDTYGEQAALQGCAQAQHEIELQVTHVNDWYPKRDNLPANHPVIEPEEPSVPKEVALCDLMQDLEDLKRARSEATTATHA